MADRETQENSRKKIANPFRSAVLRGLGVVAPPLLTFLIFMWVGSSINEYVFRPVSAYAREGLVWWLSDIRTDLHAADPELPLAKVDGRIYHRLDDDKFVPLEVYETVHKAEQDGTTPGTALGVYRRYVDLKYLRPYFVIPFLLSVFVLCLYFTGKFMAAGIGRILWAAFEWGIHRLPFVRNVYSGVKQVSDFMFNEREIEFTRVVALEYPRKGIWSIGFVTSEGFVDIRSAANEPVFTVFIPCSPMPFSGFTVTCPKSECIDLNMTFDQACQFIISCGVVMPPLPLPAEPASEGASVPALADATEGA